MILGLAFSHNSSACLADPATGEIVFCCSEERFSRRKNEWGIPRKAIQYIFEHHARPEEITKVAVGELCRSQWGSREFARLLYLSGWDVRDSYIRAKHKLAWAVAKNSLGKLGGAKGDYQGLVMEELAGLGIKAPVVFYDHHKAHAASAFYCSPYDRALVITLDGEGDSRSGSAWLGQGGELTMLDALPEVASAGKFYRAVTSMLGFKVNRHEGKITGLAAYGDEGRFASLFRVLLSTDVLEGGNRQIISRVAEAHMQSFNLRNVSPLKLAKFAGLVFSAKGWEDLLNQMLQRNFRELYGPLLGLDLDKVDFTDKADISAAAQQVLEEVVLEYVRHYQAVADTANLALAGGVFANVKLNQRLLENLPTESVYIQPGMGDEGLAPGAAMLAVHEGKKEKASKSRMSHVFLGPGYDGRSIEAALAASPFKWEKADLEGVAEAAAQALADEQIVGLFSGRLEFGPRALGHRTILVNPVKKEINDIVNQRLRRSEFMPFAPVVLDECYQAIFSGHKLEGAREAARFMTITMDVEPEWSGRIQGVVHVDNTARPQVITREDDPLYYAIVRGFHDKTGIGCVVNTSFNVHEEPIVNTPEDAVKSFADGAVDLLIMENYIVRKA